VQAAVDAAGVGDSIFISAGVYKAAADKDPLLKIEKSGLRIVGGFVKGNKTEAERNRINRTVFSGEVTKEGILIERCQSISIIGIDFEGWAGAIIANIKYNPTINPEKLLIEDCTFAVNEGSEYALLLQGANDSKVQNCTFDRNEVSAIQLYGGERVEIANSQFLGNNGHYYGAIHVHGSSDANIHDCTFEGNTSKSSGGAIIIDHSSGVLIRGNEFNGNKTPASGGAIYVNNSEKAMISQNKFINNDAQEKGGAIYSAGSEALTVKENTFEQNSAKSAGMDLAVSQKTTGIAEDNTGLTNTTFEEQDSRDFKFTAK
jgi:parallel beta-helix repeat protein